MIQQRNSYWWFKLNGILRYALSHTATKFYPLFIVNEYPKSGGSWVSQMLSDALQVPFPRNRLPMFQSSILHDHMWHKWNINNVLIVWRDGRDVLVSQYYHSLFENEIANHALVRKTQRDLSIVDYDDIQSNLPVFMRYVFEDKKYPRFNWTEFVEHWNVDGFVHLRYEDIRTSPVDELCRIVLELSGEQLDRGKAEGIIEKYSFTNMSGRKTGIENKNSFMRKGVIGDWKNHFSPEARCLFNEYAGEALISLGYEKDESWANMD